VVDLDEPLGGRSSDPPRRRVGRDLALRQVALELDELVEEAVVLGVGDLGLVQDVVRVPVAAQQRAQLGARGADWMSKGESPT
jgi:hypothetical protein